jgi:putative peptide zinc metalloprotease protein
VQAGDVVARLASPALEAAWQRQWARVAAIETELTHATAEASTGADARVGDLQAELERAHAELQRLEERRAALAVRAGTAGRVALPQPADLLQTWIPKGQLLGQVDTGEAVTVRVALPQDEVVDLSATSTVAVRLATRRQGVHPGAIVHESRAAMAHLPSAALSQAQGGPVVTDPSDPHHLKPLRPVVLLDVRLGQPADDRRLAKPEPPARLGERAWVRISMPGEPLAGRLWRSAARLLNGTTR